MVHHHDKELRPRKSPDRSVVNNSAAGIMQRKPETSTCNVSCCKMHELYRSRPQLHGRFRSILEENHALYADVLLTKAERGEKNIRDGPHI